VRLEGDVLTDGVNQGGSTSYAGGLVNSTDRRLLDASRDDEKSYREDSSVKMKRIGQSRRSPRLEGVEPKVDCWMSFEEYCKFRR